jgi:hypothetical protein
VSIDADQPLEQVMLAAKRAVWHHILRNANAPR